MRESVIWSYFITGDILNKDDNRFINQSISRTMSNNL